MTYLAHICHCALLFSIKRRWNWTKYNNVHRTLNYIYRSIITTFQNLDIKLRENLHWNHTHRANLLHLHKPLGLSFYHFNYRTIYPSILEEEEKCLSPSWVLTCPICWSVCKSSSYFMLDTLTYHSWRKKKNICPPPSQVLTRRTCWSVWTTLSLSRPCSRGAAWPVSGCWCSRSGWTSGWRCYCSLVEPSTEFLQTSATLEGCDGHR